MRRGELYWVNLEPSIGSEANKTSPAVIVSNDAANRAVQRSGHGAVTVVPVTSNTARIFPFQVLLPAAETGLSTDSKAQVERVRAIAPDRVRALIGRVQALTMSRLDAALRVHFSLD